MRLNPDCIRDVLLVVSELAIPDNYGYIEEMAPEDVISKMDSSKYEQREIMYTISLLFEENFLKQGSRYITTPIPYIADITTKGYQFIDSVKTEDSWKRAKSLFQSAVTKGLEISLTALYNIAINGALNF